MQVQFIFTFENFEQVFTRFFDIEPEHLENKDALITYAMAQLDPEEQAELVKISTCIDSEEEPPEWYMERNGKFFLDEIEVYKERNGIQTSVSEQFVDFFNTVNS